MSELYKPNNKLPPPNSDPEKASPPIPITVWRDCEIRRAMEFSVLQSEQKIQFSTKEIQASGLLSLLGISLNLSSVSLGAHLPGASNDKLKMFAYTAYDVLDKHFQETDWHDWYVAPYFVEGDDTRRTFNLGVFIDENFNQTVVE